MTPDPQLRFRYQVIPEDPAAVRKILESSGFFYDFEVDVAVELVETALQEGEKAGYFFVFAEKDGKTLGYTCFGDIPCTKCSYDIYWIGVHQQERGNGIGGLLLAETEKIIRERGGNGTYLETSGMEKYLPTRNFYLKYHYTVEAVIKDFYDYGDDKYIFVKHLNPAK